MSAIPATNSSAYCRIRITASALNPGLFDPFIANAGVDYTDSDSPLVNSTTGTCAVATPTVFVDNSVTFPADITGNFILSSARTGGTAAALDYFPIIDRVDAHTLTLGRAMAVTTDVTALTYRIGGAKAHPQDICIAATGSFSPPTISAPLIPGNRVFYNVGTYNLAGGTMTFKDGTKTAAGGGPIQFIGYGGMPIIQHGDGTLIWDMAAIKNLDFRKTANSIGSPPCVGPAGSGSWTGTVWNCRFDQGGFDTYCAYPMWGGIFFSEATNTGGGSAGTKAAFILQHPSTAMIGLFVHLTRGPCAATVGPNSGTTSCSIAFCHFVKGLAEGLVLTADSAPYMYAIFNNTFYGNAGGAIKLSASAMACASIYNNIFANNLYALEFTSSLLVNNRLQHNFVGANCYWAQTSADFNTVSDAILGSVPAWQYHDTDVRADPQFRNTSADDYRTGKFVRSKGISGLGGPSGTINGFPVHINMGAYQGAVPSEFLIPLLNGLGSGGPFFQNPLG